MTSVYAPDSIEVRPVRKVTLDDKPDVMVGKDGNPVWMSTEMYQLLDSAMAENMDVQCIACHDPTVRLIVCPKHPSYGYCRECTERNNGNFDAKVLSAGCGYCPSRRAPVDWVSFRPMMENDTSRVCRKRRIVDYILGLNCFCGQLASEFHFCSLFFDVKFCSACKGFARDLEVHQQKCLPYLHEHVCDYNENLKEIESLKEQVKNLEELARIVPRSRVVRRRVQPTTPAAQSSREEAEEVEPVRLDLTMDVQDQGIWDDETVSN